MSDNVGEDIPELITEEGHQPSDMSANKTLRDEKKLALRSISTPLLTLAAAKKNFNIINIIGNDAT